MTVAIVRLTVTIQKSHAADPKEMAQGASSTLATATAGTIVKPRESTIRHTRNGLPFVVTIMICLAVSLSSAAGACLWNANERISHTRGFLFVACAVLGGVDRPLRTQEYVTTLSMYNVPAAD